ncbi:DUF1489 domain-containing protein [Alphaproteobacteria bacterium KMM 3653]|uniref:DUF1489 domain-containing protein n=1 Tax=Harenicola maris TaxID=2841044 RepID=A0AAP2CRX5_9RHOB|nr:DUF1489 domain-containing protein [Harenicola maris]
MDNLNLVKLCVGAETLGDLTAWQASGRSHGPDGLPRHITRMWPKREAELTKGGSLYWVIKGMILARQEIIRLDEVIGEDGIRRCAIVLNPEIHQTAPTPRRAFQGWRYLQAEDAPIDITKARTGEANLPTELANALAEIGVR